MLVVFLGLTYLVALIILFWNLHLCEDCEEYLILQYIYLIMLSPEVVLFFINITTNHQQCNVDSTCMLLISVYEIEENNITTCIAKLDNGN